MRRTFLASIVLAALAVVSLATDAHAQARPGFILPAWAHAAPLTAVVVDAPAVSDLSESRPRILPALYAGSALLQALDVQLTLKGQSLGLVELNPAMRAVVKRPAAFIAVKTVATGLTVFAAERLWRTGHRKAAVVLMAVTTGMMAIVGIQNASVIRGLR